MHYAKQLSASGCVQWQREGMDDWRRSSVGNFCPGKRAFTIAYTTLLPSSKYQQWQCRYGQRGSWVAGN
ncbi:hypothetical protein IG631_13369 [Alternaria alternata]|nr:hypothetical protein IG631_13369 [Alternaria alternata]